MIDCHVHFWNYKEEDFPWIKGNLSSVAKDMLPQDFFSRSNQIEGIIAVQARPTFEENKFLLNLSKEYNQIKGIISWFDFNNYSIKKQLEIAKSNKIVKGFRHLIQDEKDPGHYLMHHIGLNIGVKEIQLAGYIYEILARQEHLKEILQFCAYHNRYTIVIDHLAKPVFNSKEHLQQWKKYMRLLSHMEHVVLKISGLVTEANPNCDALIFQEHIDIVLELFGPKRLLWGSDWPVSYSTHSYSTLETYWDFWTRNLSINERDTIETYTPKAVYNL